MFNKGDVVKVTHLGHPFEGQVFSVLWVSYSNGDCGVVSSKLTGVVNEDAKPKPLKLLLRIDHIQKVE